MSVAKRIAAAVAAGIVALSGECYGADIETFAVAEPVQGVAKSASTQSLAARATASPSATVYGGFELSASATVYILVRGPSLTTLGVTPNALDAPWVRVFDSAGRDVVTTTLTGGGTINGVARCDSSSTLDKPVIDYYQLVRNAPAHERDSCIASTFPAGAYTFSVTPSIPGLTSPTGFSSTPSSGEVLFEVTLGPSAPAVENNRTRTERLVGGTWTFNYLIGSSPFTQTYTFTSVQASTAAPGDWVAAGRDQVGDVVVGTYNSALGLWGVLDPATILDRFFTFSFSDLNHVSGCYYQLSPPGSAPGTCYPMTGIRSPFKASTVSPHPLQQDLHELAAAAMNPGIPGDAEAGSAEILRTLR